MVFGVCEDCGKEIQSGDTAWTVCVQQEKYEEECCEVLEVENVLMFCNDCVGMRDLGGLIVPSLREE